MIQAFTDILHMYWAMLLYYILKLPYAAKVIAITAITIFLAALGTTLCYKLGKRIILPLLFYLCTFVIRCLQNMVFWLVKLIPDFGENGVKIDERLNACGLWLENLRDRLKNTKSDIRKKIPLRMMILTIGIIICAFVIVPFYMESSLTGNARQTCARINLQTERIENGLWGYVNQYYTPATKVIAETIETTETTESSTEAEVILHLGPRGVQGANLRSTPDKRKDNIIEVVSGDVELFFEQEVEEVGGVVWIKIRTEQIDEGWISQSLIDEEDLERAGIVE